MGEVDKAMTKDTDDEFAELPLTHIERMDVIDRQHAQAMELKAMEEEGLTKRAELSRSETRWESLKEVAITLVVAVAVVTVLLGIGFWVYTANKPSPGELNRDQIEQQREEACYDRGGGWIGADQAVGMNGICVMPGRQS